jgi:membrane protein YdbS with pleckstrin-like domain
MMLAGATIHRSPFVFLKRLVIIEFFFAFLPFIVTWLFNLDAGYERTALAASLSFPLLAVITVTAVQIAIVAAAFIAWYLPSYTIGERSIVHRRANLIEDRRLVALRDIHGVDTHLGPLGRRLGYGDVLLDTGAQNPIRLREVPDPAHVAALLDSQRRQLVTRLGRTSQPGQLAAPDGLGQLLASGEDQYTEFKASLVWDYRQQRANKQLYRPVFKNVVAFLNSGGGRLLIGVADDGQVLGLEPDLSTLPKANADGFEHIFNQAFNSMVGVEFRQFLNVSFPSLNEQTICLIEIQPANEPAFLRLKNDEQFYIRAGNGTQPLAISTATRYIQSHFHSADRLTS